MFTEVIMFQEKYGMFLWRDDIRKLNKMKVKFPTPAGYSTYAMTKQNGFRLVDPNTAYASKDFVNGLGIVEVYRVNNNHIASIKVGMPLPFKLKNRNHTQIEHQMGVNGVAELKLGNKQFFLNKFRSFVNEDESKLNDEISRIVRDSFNSVAAVIFGSYAKANDFSEDFIYDLVSFNNIINECKDKMRTTLDEVGLSLENLNVKLNKVDELSDEINNMELDSLRKEIENRNKPAEPKKEEKKEEPKEEAKTKEDINYCFNCGKRIPDGVSYCNVCEELKEDYKKKRNKYCVKCGSKIINKMKYCGNCGHEIY